MEKVSFSNKEIYYNISVQQLQLIVDKYMQREFGSDDIDYIDSQGGIKWLLEGIQSTLEKGIQDEDFTNREEHFGSNKKDKIKLPSFLQLIWEAFEDVLLRILAVAGVVDIVLEVLVHKDERSTAWVEGFAILLSVIIILLVTAYNNLKKQKEFQKLNEKLENQKKLQSIRNGYEIEDLQVQDIQVGDIIFLKQGMDIPGDGILLQGFSITMDESSMTGETKPMKKEDLQKCLQKKFELEKKGIEKIKHDSIPSPVILSGTKVLSGTGKMIIINVGQNSAIGKIQEIITSGEVEITPLQLKLEKIARDISIFGLISAIIIFIVMLIRLLVDAGKEKWIQGAKVYLLQVLQAILTAITILVVSIPEGLPLAVTLALAFSINEMMKDQNLVRKLNACETMGSANIICSDKTGTLTKNIMEATNMWNGQVHQIYDDRTSQLISYRKIISSENIQKIFLDSIIFNSVEDPNKQNGNPTEMAILKYLSKCAVDVIQYRDQGEKIFEASFSSDRKRMSSVYKLKDGNYYVFMKGASEYILGVCDKWTNFQSGQIESINDKKNQIEESIKHMATQSLRTIGICYKKVNKDQINQENIDENGVYEFEQNNFTLTCLFGIRDIIREEVPDNI